MKPGKSGVLEEFGRTREMILIQLNHPDSGVVREISICFLASPPSPFIFLLMVGLFRYKLSTLGSLHNCITGFQPRWKVFTKNGEYELL